MTIRKLLLLLLLLGIFLGVAAAAEKGAPLFEETYQISSSTFLDSVEEGESVQGVLEKAGMKFANGAKASWNHDHRKLTLINTEKELATFEQRMGIGGNFDSPPIHVVVEHIELESEKYHDWMFENRLKADATPLRRELQEWVKSDEATVIETSVIQAMPGKRAKGESYSFFIYPSEGDPPELPNKVELDGAESAALVTGGISAAYECRNVGTSVELEAQLGADGETLSINLAPQIVKGNGYTHWPPENGGSLFTISQPKFYTMKASTHVTVRKGGYALVGTAVPKKAAVETRKKPIVLIFVRGDVSQPFQKDRTPFVAETQPKAK